MMFLFLQLVFWLVIAGLLGFAAGWFLQARRAGKKLAEHRERYKQHIQRLEQGLVEAAAEEPYAKERRDPIEVSDNPEVFLSGAEEAEARRRNMRAPGSPQPRAENSGLKSGQTVTLSPLLTAPAAASEPLVANDNELNDSSEGAAANTLVDEPSAGLVSGDASLVISAPAEWDGRLQSCEGAITMLQQRLGKLEQLCRPQKVAAKPLAKAEATMPATNKSAAKPVGKPAGGSANKSAELPASFKPYGMSAPDGEPDDLKRIWGVGPKLEGMLNNMGIFHFRQIAAFSSSDVETVSVQLEQFADRVKRDDWITQAKKLMAEVK